MSTPGSPRARQEEDRVPGRPVAVVMGAVVVITLLLCGWAAIELAPRMGPAPAHPRRAPAAIGEVNQTLIGADTAAAVLANRQRRALDRPERAGGAPRMPIAEAMRRVEAGQ